MTRLDVLTKCVSFVALNFRVLGKMASRCMSYSVVERVWARFASGRMGLQIAHSVESQSILTTWKDEETQDID